MALYDLMLSPAGMAHTGGHLRVTHHRQALRLAALVAVVVAFFGLLAAPFLPSSNLLLYVGTYIGERLLFIPSIGFCILLAHLLVAAHSKPVWPVS